LVIPDPKGTWDRDQPWYAREFEIKTEGNYDFWVANRRNETVTVVLRNKSCQCADVEMSVVDADKLDTMARNTATLSAATHLFGGAGFDPLGLNLLPVMEKIERKQMMPLEGSFKVPPADPRTGVRFAIVRLFFRAKEAGPVRLTAEIHAAGADQIPVATRFELTYMISPPVLIYPRTVPFGDIKAGETRRQEFLVWSASRPKFPLEPPPAADNPCFEFSEPVPMTADEMAKFNDRFPPTFPITRPLSGYKVMMTVHERKGDAQLDLGPINRKLKFNNATEFEAEVDVTGTVRGDVVMAGEKGEVDKIQLGEFYSDQPAHKIVQVRTSNPGIKLKYVSVSPPELEVKLTEKAGFWLLRVDVPANSVVGTLPNGSHVLLETTGAQSRRVRLPLVGAGLIR
jgi:hypothetical protein